MTQKAAICKALIEGEVLSIMDGFKKFGVSNLPREIGRGVEREFGVRVFRMPKTAKTRYGTTCTYFLYKLYNTTENRDGIKKMRKYVKEQMAKK